MNLVQNTLFVSGYWHVAGNQKRNYSAYLDNLNDTLRMIRGGHLVFYTSEVDKFDKLFQTCQDLNIQLEIIESEVSSLPAAKLAKELTQQASRMNIDSLEFLTLPSKEKGIAHFKRDLQPDAFVYQQMLTIWLSKIALVNNHLNASPFCAWIDAGFSRVRYERSNCNLQKLRTTDGRIGFYRSPMSFFGSPLPVSAGFLHANKEHWQTLSSLFIETLELFKSIPYAVDEEIIISEIHTRNPDLFYCLGEPYKLNTFFKKQLHWSYVKILKKFN